MSSVKCDVDRLTLALDQIGERAMRGISALMQEEGMNVRNLARSNAPVEEGDLEAAIKMETDRSGINGRTSVRVFVDESMVADDGTPLSEYAILMHEGLAPYGTGIAGDVYNPDYPESKSKAKAAAGHDVGGKFLERAVAERFQPLMRRVYEIARRALR